MKLTLDSEAAVLRVEDKGEARELPLYSPEAFQVLSREWVRIGWAVQYYFTFRWMGRPILQLPEDLVRLQEVVTQVRPDVIIETGVYDGGSILFHATLCEALGKGRVVGVDINISEETRSALTGHALARRIELIEGDSVAASTVAAVRSFVAPRATVMMILDSHHAKAHVARELEAYAPLVTPGSCIVVTDGIMRDLTDVPGGDAAWAEDNPASAAREFLAAHPEFELRKPATLFEITYWPEAWLWRKA